MTSSVTEYDPDRLFECKCGASFVTRAELDVHQGLDYENDSLIGRTFEDLALDSEESFVCEDGLADGEG